MKAPAFNDRIERKYQIDISKNEVAKLWRDLCSYLKPHGLDPVQQITSVASVYFDNKDFDLLRYSLLGRLMLVRLRVYEKYGSAPEAINGYWVEVKTARGERRLKRRFRLSKKELFQFLNGGEVVESVLENNVNVGPRARVRDLYKETQETIFTFGLNPILLVNTKRVAFQGAVERISIDWDLQFRRATSEIYNYDSWKDLAIPVDGQSDNVILETKYLQGDAPAWFSELQQRFPIYRREYLKPIQGMGFLFDGPLSQHKEANFFRTMIAAYMANSRLG